MPISAAEPLLEISGLESGYDKIAVLHGVEHDDRSGRGGRAARTERRGQRRRCYAPFPVWCLERRAASLSAARS